LKKNVSGIIHNIIDNCDHSSNQLYFMERKAFWQCQLFWEMIRD